MALVTCLYDIGRGNMQKGEANNHRPFSHYLEWFKHLLNVNAPLIVFIPSPGPRSGGHNLKEFIRHNRNPDWETKIILQPFEELPLYKKRHEIKSVMQHQNSPYNNLEFHSPDYIITIYSKFYFLQKAANLTRSKHLFWVDAGYFREDPKIDTYSLDQVKLNALDDKIIVQNVSLNPDKKIKDDMIYIRSLANETSACIFGGRRDSIITLCKDVITYLHVSLKKEVIGNEQQVMSLLISKNKEKYILYPEHGNGRQLLLDLSTDGHFRQTCPHLKVLTVITKEVKVSKFAKWKQSVEHFNYDYSILGREDKWQGWPYRTQKYLTALEELKDKEVAILCDGGDLFFTGSSWETYNKFKSCGHDLLIGGENIIAYNNGKYSGYKIEDYFVEKCGSRFCFPNGGFLIGRVDALIGLLKMNLNSKDDQAGYMDLIYEGKIKCKIDEENLFIANLPALGNYTQRDLDFWKWDKVKMRYYNPHTGNYPIAMHFPGNNRRAQDNIYGEVFTSSSSNNSTRGSGYNWLWLLFLIFLFVVLFLIWYCSLYKFD